MLKKKNLWEKIQHLVNCLVDTIFLIPITFAGLLILLLISFLILAFLSFSSKTEVEWYGKGYYLQQEIDPMIERGHNLFLQVDGEKQLILSHVYGYDIKKGFVYLASSQGYGVIDLRKGNAKIILKSNKVQQINTGKIQYGYNLYLLPQDDWKWVTSLKHELLAYELLHPWENGDSCTIGDGRFQYNYSRYSEEHIERNLKVWGLYGDFDEQDNLLSDVNGYKVFEDGEGEIMYVTSPEGYAIVDGLSSTCRVYFTNSDLAGKDYHEDIQVLDSYEDFTPEEQGILERVEKEGLP